MFDQTNPCVIVVITMSIVIGAEFGYTDEIPNINWRNDTQTAKKKLIKNKIIQNNETGKKI